MKIRELRERKGMTQAELARAVKVCGNPVPVGLAWTISRYWPMYWSVPLMPFMAVPCLDGQTGKQADSNIHFTLPRRR